MRLTAVLMWYDEPVSELEQTVGGLQGIADRIVAVNGRWKDPEGLEFPNADPDLWQDEIDAIHQAADEVGIDATVHRFANPVVGEIFHRNYALRLALADADWIYLTDADERIVRHEGVREKLEATDKGVGTVDFYSVDGPEGTATQWEKLGEVSYQRRVFRANPALRFERHHWYLVDDRYAYWGEVRGKRFAEAIALDMTVEHRTAVRTPERWAKKREFIAARDPADKARGWEY